MNDDIITYMRENPGGVTVESIAERFLKFKSPNKTLAETAVNAILSKDARARRGDDGLWRAAAGSNANGAGGVSETPWVSVYMLIDTTRKSIVHISLWSPLPEPACLCSVWLKDPAQFSIDDRERLCDPRDAQFDADAAAAAIDEISRALTGKVPIFFSQQHYSIFTHTAHAAGITHGIDDYYLTNQLLRAIKEPPPKPFTLDGAASALLGAFRTAESAYRQGELFCRISAELIARMKSAGVETRAQLDAALNTGAYNFAGKDITQKMIDELPAKAGVYGFTDKSGAYIYIGKAVNLKRRIESYFRFNDESPDKLNKLRSAAHGLTIHRCGSELEALIYEYRLIKKHKPALNSQSKISERKGNYKPLPDSIIILPHTQEGFCASVWIRKDQKIKLRSYEASFTEEDQIIRELNDYFYKGALPVSQDDFPELEIVTRWLKRHRDDYPIITVGNMADAAEIAAALRMET